MSRTVYTVSQKTCHSQHFVRNVDQRWPIFQIISLLDCLFVWVNSVLLLIDLLPRTTSWNPSVQSSRILYARIIESYMMGTQYIFRQNSIVK